MVFISILSSDLERRFTPSVHFYIDETLDRVERIDQLIKRIHKDDRDSG